MKHSFPNETKMLPKLPGWIALNSPRKKILVQRPGIRDANAPDFNQKREDPRPLPLIHKAYKTYKNANFAISLTS